MGSGTLALALCYSVAEYCCPLSVGSINTNLIDTQLHSSMRLISSCLQPMPLSWLPVLSNVAPPLSLKISSKLLTDNTITVCWSCIICDYWLMTVFEITFKCSESNSRVCKVCSVQPCSVWWGSKICHVLLCQCVCIGHGHKTCKKRLK